MGLKTIRYISELLNVIIIFAVAKNNYTNVEFEKEYLAELYEKGKADDKKHRFQPQIVNGYLKCVKALMNATCMEDLYTLRALNYEKLKGDKKRLSSLRINDQYRLEFREIPSQSNQMIIEICSLVDNTNHYK